MFIRWNDFKKIWAEPGLFFICILSRYNDKYSTKDYKWKKHRWCAGDSNPGPQDGRCRRIHRAMAGNMNEAFLWKEISVCCIKLVSYHYSLTEQHIVRRLKLVFIPTRTAAVHNASVWYNFLLWFCKRKSGSMGTTKSGGPNNFAYCWLRPNKELK